MPLLHQVSCVAELSRVESSFRAVDNNGYYDCLGINGVTCNLYRRPRLVAIH